MKNLIDRMKEDKRFNFSYDVSALPTYVNDQSEDIWADLLYGSGLTSRINVLEGVKGSQEIKLLNADMALQSASNCTYTSDGSIVFTGETLSTKRLYIQQDLCNENLNDTWGEMLLAIGANRQDREMPVEDIITAYLIKKSRFKNQNLMFLGDTGSGNAELAHYDGYVKLWDADADLVEVTTAQTAITASNAFDIAIELYNGIPSVLFDNDTPVEIITGRQEARAIIAQIYADKDYASSVQFVEEGGELYFTLPTTNITVRSYPQLNGLSKMYAVPYNYMYFGTDLESDIDGLEIRFIESEDQLRISNKWRSGVQYVYPEYFTKLTLS